MAKNSNKIEIIFDSQNIIELDSNNPNFDKLVKKVVQLKDECDFSNIKVKSNNKKFDEVGFQNIIKKSIKEFISKIEINEEKYKKAIEKIENL